MADFVELTDEQIDEFKEVFNIFDVDQNGTICPKELGIVMRALGQNPSEAELKEMMEDADDNGDGVIEFQEFLGLMTVLINKVDEDKKEENLLQAFHIFDKDGDGFISVGELKDFFHNLGEMTLNDEDIREMISAADMNGDGKLDYQEFKRMMFTKQKNQDDGAGITASTATTAAAKRFGVQPPAPPIRTIKPPTSHV